MRVVSFLPSATEIVAALGRERQLVGVSHACDHPSTVASLARVTSCAIDDAAAPGVVDAQVRALTGEAGALYRLDERLIRMLQPDLILTQALCQVCAVSETDVRALAAHMTPEPAVVSLSATTLDGVWDDVLRVARALSADVEGEQLVAELRARLRTVHEALAGARAPRPTVAVIEWGDPIFTGGHWVPEMVSRAGGVDVLGVSGEHSRVVTLDDLAAASPEVVVIAPCGYGLASAVSEARRLFASPAREFLAARSVWAVDANALVSRPGPRLADGVEVLARIFNPAIFAPLSPSLATRVQTDTAATAER